MYNQMVDDYRLHSFQLNVDALADEQGWLIMLAAKVSRYEESFVTISSTTVVHPMATKLSASDLLMIETELNRSWDSYLSSGSGCKAAVVNGLVQVVAMPLTFEGNFAKMVDSLSASA